MWWLMVTHMGHIGIPNSRQPKGVTKQHPVQELQVHCAWSPRSNLIAVVMCRQRKHWKILAQIQVLTARETICSHCRCVVLSHDMRYSVRWNSSCQTGEDKEGPRTVWDQLPRSQNGLHITGSFELKLKHIHPWMSNCQTRIVWLPERSPSASHLWVIAES